MALTGRKTWISNAPEADVYTVFARTSDAGARHDDVGPPEFHTAFNEKRTPRWTGR